MKNILKRIHGHLLVDYTHLNNGLYTFVNPFSYLKLRNSIFFEEMDYIGCDGILLVLLLRVFGIKSLKRLSFDMTSIARSVFAEASLSGKSIYLIGGPPGDVDKLVQSLAESYPDLRITGMRHGYFSDQAEKNATVKLICELAPDIVIVGMGVLLQEEFLVRLKAEGWKGAGFTCGGFIHQSSGNLEYYPSWVDKYQLRWLYRIADEPKLLKRYLIMYPISLQYIGYDACIYWGHRLITRLRSALHMKRDVDSQNG